MTLTTATVLPSGSATNDDGPSDAAADTPAPPHAQTVAPELGAQLTAAQLLPGSEQLARVHELRRVCATLHGTSAYTTGCNPPSPQGRWVTFDCMCHQGHQYVVMQLRISSRGRRGDGTLSERERLVARSVAKGDSLKVIADACSISLQAVSTYLLRAKRKLGVTSQADLVRAVMCDGMPGPALDRRPQLLLQLRLGNDWFRIFRHHALSSDQLTSALTPAEREILVAVVGGLRTAQIAQRRGTAAGTVAAQVSAIMRKLKVQSRAELIAAVLAPRS
jgi:DNA-binding CsgD family transcriptional regulator